MEWKISVFVISGKRFADLTRMSIAPGACHLACFSSEMFSTHYVVHVLKVAAIVNTEISMPTQDVHRFWTWYCMAFLQDSPSPCSPLPSPHTHTYNVESETYMCVKFIHLLSLIITYFSFRMGQENLPGPAWFQLDGLSALAVGLFFTMHHRF